MAEVRQLLRRSDARGSVFEVLRPEHVQAAGFGQIYVFTAALGAAKGNHYHKRKKEWFLVLQGSAELVLLDLDSGQRETVMLNASQPTIVTIPPNVAHAVRNVGEVELQVLAYITEAFNPDDPDTFPYALL